MKSKCLILVAGITAALSCSALGQQDEKLGKLAQFEKASVGVIGEAPLRQHAQAQELLVVLL